jgi:nickel-dependent lactate racemase
MRRKIEFKYGQGRVPIDLPDTVDVLSIQEPVVDINRKKFEADIADALPKDLPHNAVVSIVVADKTRLCGYDVYLPWVKDLLHKKGIHTEQISFFIAYGTHARQSDRESTNAYGHIYQTCRFVHHDANDKALFASLGKTRHGTPIHVRQDLLKSDVIITMGALSHHYFAGYGGGRKLLFPGLGYRQDIYQNHSRFLDRAAGKLCPGCRPGNLDHNPLALDLKQVDDALEIPRVSIHGILDSRGRVCRLIVGTRYDDFVSACTLLDSFYKTRSVKNYDLVIASCGGFPKDINFIQAHKAINNAAMFVRDKGSLVIFAQCRDGIGSDAFMPYFDFKGFKEAFEVLARDYKGNGGTALSMMAKTGRIKLFLKTALDDKICRKIGVKRVDAAGIQEMVDTSGRETAVIENASLLIKTK